MNPLTAAAPETVRLFAEAILRCLQLLRQLKFGRGFVWSPELGKDTTQQVMNPGIFRVKLRQLRKYQLSLVWLARALQEHGHIFIRAYVVGIRRESLLDPVAGSILLTRLKRQVS